MIVFGKIRGQKQRTKKGRPEPPFWSLIDYLRFLTDFDLHSHQLAFALDQEGGFFADLQAADNLLHVVKFFDLLPIDFQDNVASFKACFIGSSVFDYRTDEYAFCVAQLEIIC